MRPLIADRRSRIHRSLGRSFLACLAQRKQMDAIFEGERLQRNQAPTLQISLSSQVQFLPPIAQRASLVYCRPRQTPGSANNIRYHMTSYMSHMFASFPSAMSSQQKILLGSFCFVPLFVSHVHLCNSSQPQNANNQYCHHHKPQQRTTTTKQRQSQKHKTHRLAFSSGRKMWTLSSSCAKAFKPSKQLCP